MAIVYYFKFPLGAKRRSTLGELLTTENTEII